MVLVHTPPAECGTPLPSFSLPAVDGKEYSEKDCMGAKGAVVVFTCNHCPYAKAVRPRIIRLAEEFQPKGIRFVAINSNNADRYPEDSFEKMKEEQYNFPFPYMRDETQEVARAFGAVCTPDIFVYDGTGRLVYRGRVDDNWQDEAQVTREDLREALEALIEGREIPDPQFPSMGCSLKWKEE